MDKTAHSMFDVYLNQEARKASYWASKIGVSAQTISRWRNGHETPNKTAQILIGYVTDGAITPEDWARTSAGKDVQQCNL